MVVGTEHLESTEDALVHLHEVAQLEPLEAVHGEDTSATAIKQVSTRLRQECQQRTNRADLTRTDFGGSEDGGLRLEMGQRI